MWRKRTRAIDEPPVEPQAARSATVQTLLMVARLLVLVGVVLWLSPPRPKPPPRLPDTWTPGCPELSAEWHEARTPEGTSWHPWLVYVEPDAIYARTVSFSGGASAWHRVAANGSSIVAPPSIGNLEFGIVLRDGILWRVLSQPDAVGVFGLDAKSLEPAYQREAKGLKVRAHGPLMDLQDGGLGIACVEKVGDSVLKFLLVLDPVTGGLTKRPLPQADFACRQAANGDLIALQGGGEPSFTIDPISGQVLPGERRTKTAIRPGLVAEVSAVGSIRPTGDQEVISFWTWVAQARTRLWVAMIGESRTVEALASTVRITRLGLHCGSRADPLVILSKDMHETIKSSADLGVAMETNHQSHNGRYLARALLDVAPGVHLAETDGPDVFISQAVAGTPASINGGHPIIRFGTIPTGTADITWHGWLPLPTSADTLGDFQPNIRRSNGQWHIALWCNERTPAWDARSVMFLWTTIPELPEIPLYRRTQATTMTLVTR